MTEAPDPELLAFSQDIFDAYSHRETAEREENARVAYENICRAIEKVGKRHLILAQRLNRHALQRLAHDVEAIVSRCRDSGLAGTINEIADLCQGHDLARFREARYPPAWNTAAPTRLEIQNLILGFDMLTKLVIVRWAHEARAANDDLIRFVRDRTGVDIRGVRISDVTVPS